MTNTNDRKTWSVILGSSGNQGPTLPGQEEVPGENGKHPSLLRRVEKAAKGRLRPPSKVEVPCTAMLSELASVLGSALSMG